MGGKLMMCRKEVIFTPGQLVGAIRAHGLPITLEAAGSGVETCISSVFQVARKSRRILQVAQVMGNGLVIND
ncbi:hypothetical protein CL652_01610 [bacterium]|nr:hypothetical protein [bacterium]